MVTRNANEHWVREIQGVELHTLSRPRIVIIKSDKNEKQLGEATFKSGPDAFRSDTFLIIRTANVPNFIKNNDYD